MNQAQYTLTISTKGRELHEITPHIVAWVSARSISVGLLTIFVRHTSASLLIQENAAPDARRDLQAFFDRLVPEAANLYRHSEEGPDDMPAHIRAALTQTSLSVPIIAGELALGTWQGIYLYEHRRAPHRREIILHLIGA